MTIQISVIIPVFNAAPFVKKAVLSALAQPEVAEVIIIDDGSTDNSYELCQTLVAKHKKILLLTHSDHANKGVSASRNLGIQTSCQKYITFLDADDYYLPNRFKSIAKKFQEKPNILGIYSGHRIEGDEYSGLGKLKMNSKVPSEQLFEYLITSQEYFYIIDLTIRKSKLPEGFQFDEALSFGEDTDFILSLCLVGDLIHCELDKPVLSRVIHSNNTIHNKHKERAGKYLLSQKWLNKSINTNWSKSIRRKFLFNLLEGKFGHIQNKGLRYFKKGVHLCQILIQNPKLLLKIL